MKIENEFGVDVPVERAWEALTDLESLAPCMPGAQLTGVEDDVYKGRVKIKVGPVISQFAGTARFEEKDDTAHRAVIAAAGKDARGGGNASARIHAHLHPDGTGTRVQVDTDLTISGRLAQFGSGMIKEISEKLLAQFVQNLEAQLHTAPPAAETAPAAPAPTPAPAPAAPASAPAEPAPAPVEAAPATGTDGTAPDPLRPAAGAAVNGTAPSPSAPAEPPAGAADTASTAGGTPSTAPAAHPTAPSAAASGATAEPEALDLMSLAGSSVYKRLIPAAVLVLIVIGVVVWLLVR